MRLLQILHYLRGWSAGAWALAAAAQALAQADLPVYTDHLVNGFQDWSWAQRNLAGTSPVQAGTYSISVSSGYWQALSFYHSELDTSPYSNLSFWLNGGAGGGQLLVVVALLGGVAQPGYALPALPPNTWQQVNLPLASLGAANKTNLNRFWFQLAPSGTTNTYYVDAIQFTAKPAPPLVHLAVNATQSVRAVDARWFGVNTAVWDWDFDKPETVSLLAEMGTRLLRFPGGSMSDAYHWRSNYVVGSSWQGWPTWFTNFAHVATNVGAQGLITVNYGSGKPAEAADWVRYSNVTNHYGFKYWELGNENYGTWELDLNTNAPYHAHDAWTYATRAKDYLLQMKAAEPAIKVGVVLAPGENSYSNAFAPLHPAVNPRTGQTNYGWTPILLSTLSNLNVLPDFAVHHVYPEWTGQESDPLLLQSSVSWARDAADLRQQLSDYLGPAGANIELLCTENNSNAGDQGKQSTSLVNALYLVDSLAQLMQTEFNAYVWWDLRNGSDLNGSFDATLYGWRTYGDLGLINGLNTRHPAFYGAKLMQSFARPGDAILGAVSDYLLLSAYAARGNSGALSLLVLNKDRLTNFTGQVALSGFTPDPVATLRCYGIPQDEAARTNGTAQAQDIAVTSFTSASTNFTCTFPPLSVTLFNFAPAAPRLLVLPPTPQPGGQFLFQLQGQPGVRYRVQSSTNLNSTNSSAWTTLSTNTLSGNTLNFTNPVPAGTIARFWRALWQP